MPYVSIGDNDSNKIKILLKDVKDILYTSTKTILTRIRDADGIAIGYINNDTVSPWITLHTGEIFHPYPLKAVVIVMVQTKGNGNEEQVEDLLDAAGAVADELITDTDNRRTDNDWICVTDQVKWIPHEEPIPKNQLFKAYQMMIEYQYGGDYVA